MRFKAEFPREMHSTVMGMLQCLAAMDSSTGKSCGRKIVLQISPQGWNIILVRECADDVLAYADLGTAAFTDFRVQSKSDDCIWLAMSLGHLVQALKSSKDGESTKLKLAKRDDEPCIVVEIDTMEAEVSHKVPVAIIAREEMDVLRPPDLPQPAVMLRLPEHKTLRTVVEKLKGIGDRQRGNTKYVSLKAEACGNISLRCDTDTAAIKTFFSDLQPSATQPPGGGARATDVTVKVESKKLCQALSCYQMDFESIDCCPIERHALVLYVTLQRGLGTVSYYINTVEDDDDNL
ncbi:checkpoint protein Hus1/Mec3 [Pelagophyceae sp. CCMP2097]|nr:checkpoint protein Hus1/Mec3 [Pelagophyceae sp. CCMP2097]